MTDLVADVSYHQGTINFPKMKKAGVAGVIIRAGYRTAKNGKVETDANFSQNINAAVAAKLPVGVYWWTTALSSAEAEAEASYCLKLIRNYQLSFPIWLDIEFYNSKREGRADHLTKAKRTEYAVAFLETVKKAGYQAGVYCNKDFWSDALNSAQLQKYPRWIARYGASNPLECDMWQYTSSADGKKFGVESKTLDLSYCYTNFIAGKQSKFPSTQKGVKNMDLLRSGDRGQQVRVLQKLLGGLAVDGIFGPNTQDAVKTYQKKKDLAVDGIVGPKTWDALLA